MVTNLGIFVFNHSFGFCNFYFVNLELEFVIFICWNIWIPDLNLRVFFSCIPLQRVHVFVTSHLVRPLSHYLKSASYNWMHLTSLTLILSLHFSHRINYIQCWWKITKFRSFQPYLQPNFTTISTMLSEFLRHVISFISFSKIRGQPKIWWLFFGK